MIAVVTMKVFSATFFFFLAIVQGQFAPECGYIREPYYPDIWISSPPLLIEDTSVTVYFCSDHSIFYGYYPPLCGDISTRAAIRETSSEGTWNYTESFFSCYDNECQDLYNQNYSDYLVTFRTFNALTPNTLYSLEFLGCSEHCDSCTVGNSHFSYSINITTRPEVPQFQWVATAETIQVYFQEDYFTGPPPDGHEVLVLKKSRAPPSTEAILSHYFPLSMLSATIEDLLPSTEYFMYLRANGTLVANIQGAWVVREVKTRPPASGPVNSATTSAVVYSTPSDVAGTLLLQWTPPTQFDGDSLLQYEVTLTPLGAGSAVQVRYILPGTQSQLTAQGLQVGEEYQVEIETRVYSGLLQPFYSMNITIPTSPANLAAVANGAAGAGVILVVVLVCAAVVGVVVVLVYLRWKRASKKEGPVECQRSTLQRNFSGVYDEVAMKANPAYGAFAFEGGDSIDPHTDEIRYQSRDDADIEGLGDGEGDDAASGGDVEGLRGDDAASGGDVEGLRCDESRKEKSDQVFYENVTR